MIMLASTPDMVRVAQDLSVPVPQAANAFFAVGSRFALGWLRASAEALAQTGSHWEKLAIAAVIDELYTDQRAITTAVLRTLLDSDQADPENVDSMAAIEAWADGRRPAVERAEQLVNELRSASTIDLAMLTVASRQFGALKDA
jgi:glutamate dehydrogenase